MWKGFSLQDATSCIFYLSSQGGAFSNPPWHALPRKLREEEAWPYPDLTHLLNTNNSPFLLPPHLQIYTRCLENLNMILSMSNCTTRSGFFSIITPASELHCLWCSVYFKGSNYMVLLAGNLGLVKESCSQTPSHRTQRKLLVATTIIMLLL